MPQPRDPDPLVPTLHEVERELEERLREACSVGEAGEETTGELIRLEETLLDAARVAKQAVSVRRRLRTRAEAETGDTADAERGAEATATNEHQLAAATSADDCTIRNFVDAEGVEWQAWEVTPGGAASARGGAFLAAYREGWLAFESLDGARRRRLLAFPRDWAKRSNADLERLLGQAEEVRKRVKLRNEGESGT